jgi:thiol-disulfide isomerase/thioredoxin
LPYLVTAVVILAVLVLVDLVLTFGVIKRLREHAQLLAAGPGGMPSMRQPGELVGDFTATSVDGESVSRQFDAPTAVAFFSRHCPACAKRLPEFVAYAQDLPADCARPLVILIGDDTDELVTTLREVSRVIIEPVNGPVSKAFGVKATPSLCMVSPSGRVIDSGHDMTALAALTSA